MKTNICGSQTVAPLGLKTSFVCVYKFTKLSPHWG